MLAAEIAAAGPIVVTAYGAPDGVNVIEATGRLGESDLVILH